VISADQYDVFEQMHHVCFHYVCFHYVCFHYEFEHDPADPDAECRAGGCPSANPSSPPRRDYTMASRARAPLALMSEGQSGLTWVARKSKLSCLPGSMANRTVTVCADASFFGSERRICAHCRGLSAYSGRTIRSWWV
jgi:hypothetical protein